MDLSVPHYLDALQRYQEDRGVCSPRITATHDLVVNGTHSQRWAFSQVIRRLAQEHLDLLRVIILNDRTK